MDLPGMVTKQRQILTHLEILWELLVKKTRDRLAAGEKAPEGRCLEQMLFPPFFSSESVNVSRGVPIFRVRKMK